MGREFNLPVRVEKMGPNKRGRPENFDSDDEEVDYRRPRKKNKDKGLGAHRQRAESSFEEQVPQTAEQKPEASTTQEKIAEFGTQVDERVADFSEFPLEVDAAENPEAQGLIQRAQEAGQTFHASVDEVKGVSEETPQTVESVASDVPQPPEPAEPVVETEPDPHTLLIEKSEPILGALAARLDATQAGVDHGPYVAALRKKIAESDFETPTEYLITQGDQQVTESTLSPRDEFFALLDDLSTKADLEDKAHPDEKNVFAEEAEKVQETLELMNRVSAEKANVQNAGVEATEGVEPQAAEKEKSLEDLRKDYATALANRGKFFNRTSKDVLDETGSRYEEAVKNLLQEQFLKKAEGLDLNVPEQQQKFMELSAEGVIGAMQEREQLLEAMNDINKGKFSQKFKQFWRSHPKLRLAVGLGLGAGAAVMAATGNIPVAAGFMYGRAAMSGTGTAMTTEAVFDLARKKWGATKEMNETEIDSMTVDDVGKLEELHAAHTIEASMKGVKRGEKTTLMGKGKGTFSETSQRIDAKLADLKKQEYLAEMKKLKEEGVSDEELVSGHMFEYLNQQEIRGHEQLQKRQDRVRLQNIAKWTGATFAGATVGWLIGSKAEAMSEASKAAKDAAKQQATEAEPGPYAKQMLENLNDDKWKAAVEHPQTPGAAEISPEAPQSESTEFVGQPEPEQVSEAPEPEVGPYAKQMLENLHDDKWKEALEQQPKFPGNESVVGTEAPHETSIDSALQDNPQRVAFEMPTQPADATRVDMPVLENQEPVDNVISGGASQQGPEFVGPPAPEQAAQAAEFASTAVSGVETVQKGDTVWGLVKHQLQERLGDKFTGLNEAQQTHLIDQFKDKIVEHPEQFGLKNPDAISVGDKIDLSPLFPDEKTVAEALRTSTSLSEQAMEHIVENNKAIRDAAQHAAEHAADSAPDTAATKGASFLNPDDWKFKTDIAHEASSADAGTDAAQINPETAVPPEEAVSAESEVAVEQGTLPEDLGKLRELATDKHEVILLEKSIKPLEKIGDITDTLPDSTISRMADLTIQDYMKGAAFKKIEVMEGVSSKVAKTFVENVKDLVKHVDKVRDVKVNREWTLGALSKAVMLIEKNK